MKHFKVIRLEENEDSMICETCGRYIRNAIEIDGVVYGMDCGAKKLEWQQKSKSQIQKKANRIQYAIDNFKFQYNKYGATDIKTDMAAGYLARELGIIVGRTAEDMNNLYTMIA